MCSPRKLARHLRPVRQRRRRSHEQVVDHRRRRRPEHHLRADLATRGHSHRNFLRLVVSCWKTRTRTRCASPTTQPWSECARRASRTRRAVFEALQRAHSDDVRLASPTRLPASPLVPTWRLRANHPSAVRLGAASGGGERRRQRAARSSAWCTRVPVVNSALDSPPRACKRWRRVTAGGGGRWRCCRRWRVVRDGLRMHVGKYAGLQRREPPNATHLYARRSIAVNRIKASKTIRAQGAPPASTGSTSREQGIDLGRFNDCRVPDPMPASSASRAR